jgi:general secretion pathway protein K
MKFSRANPNAANERGIALIIVMISIFVLTMLAGAFALSMKVETKLARNANSETELEWLGRSAVECARWELAEQLKIGQEPYDGLDQVWAGGQGGIGTSNSPLADFKHEIETVTGGKATWTIIDLERRANINAMLANQNGMPANPGNPGNPAMPGGGGPTQPLLEHALEIMQIDPGEGTALANCILDWIDPSTLPNSHRMQGAKSDYYQGLTPPYSAKNGPIDDISEALLIKGITPEIFFGMQSTNYMPGTFNARNRRFGVQNVMGPPIALTNVFTALSSGQINVNTASAEVLQIIPGVTPELAQAIVSARSGEDDGSGLMGPYRSVQQVGRVAEPRPPPGVLTMMQQYCGVRSRTFEVHVDAESAGYHRHFTGIIGRNNPRDLQVLSFYWSD